jgi:hypothetical protein
MKEQLSEVFAFIVRSNACGFAEYDPAHESKRYPAEGTAVT